MTERIRNTQAFKKRRRALRRAQTDAEKKLWHILRGKRLSGLKFFRQYSIGNYILDFYCPLKKLAIEADGSQHIENEYDDERARYLEKQGIQILRFWDNDILMNIEGVYGKIVAIITPPILPLSQGEE
ncbi:MAG: endonuclease domain-containing protein [bacterium]|nr:endonuclease domain-containing protein [bacterium]